MPLHTQDFGSHGEIIVSGNTITSASRRGNISTTFNNPKNKTGTATNTGGAKTMNMINKMMKRKSK